MHDTHVYPKVKRYVVYTSLRIYTEVNMHVGLLVPLKNLSHLPAITLRSHCDLKSVKA